MRRGIFRFCFIDKKKYILVAQIAILPPALDLLKTIFENGYMLLADV